MRRSITHSYRCFNSSVQTGDILWSNDFVLSLGSAHAPGFSSAEREMHCLSQLMFLSKSRTAARVCVLVHVYRHTLAWCSKYKVIKFSVLSYLSGFTGNFTNIH